MSGRVGHKFHANHIAFKRCPVCKQVYVKQYFNLHECGGPPAEVAAIERAKGWKKGRK